MKEKTIVTKVAIFVAAISIMLAGILSAFVKKPSLNVFAYEFEEVVITLTKLEEDEYGITFMGSDGVEYHAEHGSDYMYISDDFVFDSTYELPDYGIYNGTRYEITYALLELGNKSMDLIARGLCNDLSYVGLRFANGYVQSNCPTINIFITDSFAFNFNCEPLSVECVDMAIRNKYVEWSLDILLGNGMSIFDEHYSETGGKHVAFDGKGFCNLNIYVNQHSMDIYNNLDDNATISYDEDEGVVTANFKQFVNAYNQFFDLSNASRRDVSMLEKFMPYKYDTNIDYTRTAWEDVKDDYIEAIPDGRKIQVLSLEEYMEDTSNQSQEAYAKLNARKIAESPSTGVVSDIILPSVIVLTTSTTLLFVLTHKKKMAK